MWHHRPWLVYPVENYIPFIFWLFLISKTAPVKIFFAKEITAFNSERNRPPHHQPSSHTSRAHAEMAGKQILIDHIGYSFCAAETPSQSAPVLEESISHTEELEAALASTAPFVFDLHRNVVPELLENCVKLDHLFALLDRWQHIILPQATIFTINGIIFYNFTRISRLKRRSGNLRRRPTS